MLIPPIIASNVLISTAPGGDGEMGYFIVLVGLILAICFFFLKSSVRFEDEFHKLKQDWEKRNAQLETFFESPEYVEALNKAADTLEAASKETKPDQPGSKPDHKLPLSVADEINRMRVRLEKMEKEDIKVKPLTKALERLEEKLNDLGYEIVDLKGKPYVDGMTAKCQFVPVDTLGKDEQVITRVISPQVNYNGKLAQVPELEVSVG